MKVFGIGRPRRVPLYLGLLLASLFAIWPVFIMVLEGFDMDIGPIFSGNGLSFIGGAPYYSGGFFPSYALYYDAFAIGNFPRLVLNSTTIALVSVGLALAAGIPAAYALARLKLRGIGILGFLLLALRTVSPFAIVLPLYLLYTQTGLYDTYLGMGLAYLVINLPIVVWMLRGFFTDLPSSLYEAAELFGATERQVFWKIALPSVLLGVVATAVFAFVLVWNEFLMASILTASSAKTVSIAVWSGVGERFIGFKSANWDELNAGGTLAFIPAFAIVLVIRKYLAKGFSLATTG